MIPDLTAVLEEAAAALETTMTEERGLLNEAIELSSGPHIMWRDRVERNLTTVTERAGMSAPVWSAGRPARWLQSAHPELGRLGLTASGGALALYLYAVPLQDRPRRVLVPCPAEVVKAFEDQD